MTSHEEQDYKYKYPLADINKGPGTNALLAAKVGDSFTFDGTKLVDGEYYSFGILRLPVEIQHLGDHNFVLWFPHYYGYPRWVERMVYNGHSRLGLSETWERQLSPTATAEEKAEHEDAGSTLMMPVPLLWYMSAVFGLLFGLGVYILSTGERSGAAGFFVFIGLFSSIGMVEFAGMAIWKWNRDGFWRALDVINSLDLRRLPNNK